MTAKEMFKQLDMEQEQTVGRITYYFNNDGCMATGTTIIDGVTHYFDAVGAKVF